MRFVHDHGFLRSLRRWLFYVVVLNAVFAAPVLLARSYGYAPLHDGIVQVVYACCAALAILGASAMIYRVTRTGFLSLEAGYLITPHYLWPVIPLGNVTAVYVNPRTPGVLLLGVHRQLPRYVHTAALSPPITSAELADHIRMAIASIDAGSARGLEHTRRLDARSQGMPRATIGLAAALAAVHLLAWWAGSRFDDLDLLGQGAYLHSLAVQGDWLRILDATLLHASVPHLLANLATLLAVGATLEHTITPRALLATFILSGSIAMAGSGWLSPELIHVGASGGLFGLIGVLAALRIARPVLLPSAMIAVPAWLLVAVLALSLGVSMPGMDWVAHAIGLLAGVAIGTQLARTRPGEDGSASHLTTPPVSRRVASVLSACAAAGILVGLVDVSRRTLMTGEGLRQASLAQLVSSEPDLDALNAIAWQSLVLRGEHRAMAGAVSRALKEQASLGPAQRDTLAALHFLSGSADAAAREQLIALLTAAHLPPATQTEMAARLALYLTRTTTDPAGQSSVVATADDACVRMAVVTYAGAQPARLRIQTLRTRAGAPVQGHPAERTWWISTPTRDCSGDPRGWTLDRAAWRQAEALMRAG